MITVQVLAAGVIRTIIVSAKPYIYMTRGAGVGGSIVQLSLLNNSFRKLQLFQVGDQDDLFFKTT